MKKFSVLLAMGLLFSLLFISCDDDDDNYQRIDFSETPVAVQDFVKDHFTGVNVIYAEKNYNGYSVKLSGDIYMHFTTDGAWSKVDVNDIAEMPQSVIDLIPEKIVGYLETNHEGRKIESITVKTTGYEVELQGNPDVEIIFDKEGNFVQYED